MQKQTPGIFSKVDSNGDRIYFSLAQKQSESGLSYNARLIMLVDQHYFGYTALVNKDDIIGSCRPENIKKRINLEQFRSILPKGNILNLTMNDIDNGKLKSLKWKFRMESAQIATSWSDMLERQTSPSPSRKPTEQKPPAASHEQKNPTIQEIVQFVEKKNIPTVDLKPNEKQQEKVLENPSDQYQRDYSFQEKTEKPQQSLEPPIREEASKSQKKIESFAAELNKYVDYTLVESQLSKYKQTALKHKASQSEARTMSEPLSPSKKIEDKNFMNYLRPIFNNIDDRIYQQFYNFCLDAMQKLTLAESSQKIEKLAKSIRQKNGVIANIIFVELKQIPGDNCVCDEGILKSYLNQLKNMDYIWKVISHDKTLREIFFMPMCCIVESKGLVAFFKCDFDKQDKSSQLQDYSQYFERLAQLTCIHKSVLGSQSAIKFSKYHNKFIISQVNEYLPRLTYNSSMIRPQLFSLVFENSEGAPYVPMKGKKSEEQQNKLFKQPLEESIMVTARNLDKLQQYFLHPREFSAILHSYGLNINLMKRMLRFIDNTFMKSIMKTEAALRAFKMLFRKRMQEIVGAGDSEEEASKQIPMAYLKIGKGMLNVLLSNTEESDTLWRIVTLHSQVYFQIPVEKGEMNKGYLLLGLEHYLGLKIQSIYRSSDKIFSVTDFVQSIEFSAKVKMGKIFWTDFIEQLPSTQAAEETISMFNLGKASLPFYVYQDKQQLQKILNVVSLHYGPNSELKNVGMYSRQVENSELTLSYYRRKITQIKWSVKDGRPPIEQIEKRLEQLVEPLKYYFGNYHPFYAEVFDMLEAINESYGNYDAAMQYCKRGLTNMMQLCGGNNMHLKLASNYYQMGECYGAWMKSDEAISSYKKAKNILEFNEYAKDKEYALIELKLAMLYLSKFKDNEAYKLLVHSLEIMTTKAEDSNESFQSAIECLELLSRCDADPLNRVSFLIEYSHRILKKGLELDRLSDNEVMRLTKVIFQNYFIENSREINQNFVTLVSELSDRLLMSGEHPEFEGVQILKEFYENDLFFPTISGFGEKSEEIQQSKGKMAAKTKEIQNFEKLMKILLLILGQNFVLGVIRA